MTTHQGTRAAVLLYDGRVVQVPTQGRARIGRHPANDIRLDLPAISRFHAEVRWEGARLVLHDRDSQNGTHLDGERIAGPTPLEHGAVFTVSGVQIEVRLEDSETPALLDDDSGDEVTLFDHPDSERSGAYAQPAELHRLLLELESAHETGACRIEPSDGEPGALVFADGRLVAARCGGRTGLDALERLARSAGGRYAFSARFEPVDGVLDLSVRTYLRTGYWETLEVTSRWQKPHTKALRAAAAGAGSFQDWLQGEDDLRELLGRLEQEALSGTLLLALNGECFALAFAKGRIHALARDGAGQPLCLRAVCDAARHGGEARFRAAQGAETAPGGALPHDLLLRLAR